MHYCDSLCQKKDWKGKHKHECPLFADQYNKFDSMARLVLRLSLMAEHCPQELKQQFFAKATDRNEQPKGFTFDDLPTCVESLCKDHDKLNDDKLAFLGKLWVNVRGIYDWSLTPIGGGLYVAETVLTTHSCSPNASLMFRGTQVELRAMDEIKVGQPITISYIRLTKPKVERQAELKKQYYLDCQCDKCEHDTDKGELTPSLSTTH